MEGFLDDSFVYDFYQGPAQVRTREDAIRSGLNCVALAHLALGQLFEQELPPELHCYEMFSDHDLFATIAQDNMLPGDLVWFGREDPSVPIDRFTPEYEDGYLLNWLDFAVNHVAIYTGLSQDGEPLLLHASPNDGTNAIWPLGDFAKYSRYEKIYRISRLVLGSLKERNLE